MKSKYLEYYRDLNSHPEYAETWNTFWYENASAYKAENKDPQGDEFTNHWKFFWDHRLAALEEEDVLRMRVCLRKEMNLENEPRDQKIFNQIIQKSNKFSAIVEYDRSSSERSFLLKAELRRPTLSEKLLPTLAVEDEKHETVGSAFKAPAKKNLREKDDLPDNDIVYLFRNYKDLSDKERQCLKSYMDILKARDYERFKLILSLTEGHGECLKSQIGNGKELVDC